MSVFSSESSQNTSVEESEEEISKFDKSLLLRLPKFSKGYTTEDFMVVLEKFVSSEDIISLGVLKFPNEWCLTLSSKDSREKLLQLGYTTVKKRKCVVHPLCQTEIRGRIHWLPAEIPDLFVINKLKHFGEVTSFETEHWSDDTSKVQKCVRSFSLKLVRSALKEDLPHYITVNKCDALVIVKGRDPMCFGCKQVGHRKAKCPFTNTRFISKAKKKEAGQQNMRYGASGHLMIEKETQTVDMTLASTSTDVTAGSSTAKKKRSTVVSKTGDLNNSSEISSDNLVLKLMQRLSNPLSESNGRNPQPRQKKTPLQQKHNKEPRKNGKYDQAAANNVPVTSRSTAKKDSSEQEVESASATLDKVGKAEVGALGDSTTAKKTEEVNVQVSMKEPNNEDLNKNIANKKKRRKKKKKASESVRPEVSEP